MTEKDKKLIKKAWDISSSEWYKVGYLIEEADTQEAKEELVTIRNAKYHEDEFKSNLD